MQLPASAVFRIMTPKSDFEVRGDGAERPPPYLSYEKRGLTPLPLYPLVTYHFLPLLL